MTDPSSLDPLRGLTLGLDSTTAPLGGARWTPPTPAELSGLPNLEVLQLIGVGGMGAVYCARQTHLDRLVALKLMAPDLAQRPGFPERFAREARAMARLDHPAIVRLYDFGETGQWLWLVIELVDGATLREVMRTGRLSAREALELVPHLCAALTHAHAAGVVHRDLKPENILIDGAGRPHLTDFGLAKLGDDAASLTATGSVLGTAHYMAPEQVAGDHGVDHRADLYALGVVVYEMLTGVLPLGRFAPPSQGADAGHVTAQVDAAVLKSLERQPERRWQSAEELRQALASVPSAAAPGAAAPPLPVAPASPPPVGDPPGGDPHDDWRDHHRMHRAFWRMRAAKWRARGTEVGGSAKLFHCGMWQLVGGLLLAVWVLFKGPDAVHSLPLTMLTLAACGGMVLGGLSLLLAIGLPLAVVGAVSSLLAVPWLWLWVDHFFLLVLPVFQVIQALTVLRIPRLRRHYAASPDIATWQRVLGAVVLTLAIGAATTYTLVSRFARSETMPTPSAAYFQWTDTPAEGAGVWLAGADAPPEAAVRRRSDGSLVIDGSRLPTDDRSVELARIDGSWVHGRSWQLRTRIRYHEVSGEGYAVLWNHFADGGTYFTRALAKSGPMGSISGSSEWRELALPFDATGSKEPLKKLVFSLVLPGSGTVEIEPFTLAPGEWQ